MEYISICGSKEAITYQQTSPRRYFQRPDAEYLTLDTNRTSLSGTGGTVAGGKIGGGHWNYGGLVSWRSPGLELNDMGYMREADVIQQIAYTGYKNWEPFYIFRTFNLNAAQWAGWDFGGEMLYLGGNVNVHMKFKNYWSFGTGVNRNSQERSKTDLRGGPALLLPGSFSIWSFVQTDERKKLVFQVRGNASYGDHNFSRMYGAGVEIGYRPLDALKFSIEPSYDNSRWDMQYITTKDYNGSDRYIVSAIKTENFGADIRVDLGITPDISIQYWGQPFLFSGQYSEFKRITEPQAGNYDNRYHSFTQDEISYNKTDNTYSIDETGDGTADYTFYNPDFTVFEFRSNFVARWEYIPGSTVYLVWSQGRDGFQETGDFNIPDGMNDLFSIKPHNIFLIKISYRISL